MCMLASRRPDLCIAMRLLASGAQTVELQRDSSQVPADYKEHNHGPRMAPLALLPHTNKDTRSCSK